MKRGWLILIGGLVLAMLAYGGSYFAGMARSNRITANQTPELAWLQNEFHLSDSEFTRICQLHESYAGGCAERCRRIDAKNKELENLLAKTNAVTPEIQKALQEAAQLRADCQAAMLQHFYEVSRTMPPDQGKRYFTWGVSCTVGSEHVSMMSVPGNTGHEHHDE